ncbi:hypothetical protein AN958_07463, partial [Leucoagaricus sp. SymC.cos]
IADQYHIHHIQISAYNSQSNDVVETTHRTIHDGLVKMCARYIKSYDSRGVKLIIHIWVHDISEPGLLSVHGMSEAWELLKETFEGAVEMDQVSLLLTGWEKVRLEKGVKGMLKIRQALMEDEKNGLLFAWLLVPDRSAAWLVLGDMIELSKVGVDGKRDIAKRILRNDVPGVDETRLVFVQHDIRELCTKLDESAEGRKLREEIQKYFANHEARIEPLLAQIDDEHEIGRKKKEALATVEHEHLLFRKTMWSFFEAIEKLEQEVPIGRHLQAFYGFNANPRPRPPPKRLGFFKRLF